MKTQKHSVQSTRNYSLFTVDETNRVVRPSKKLRKSLEAYGWLPAYPMHVVRRNGRLVIIDGQHRFKEAQRLNIAVLYVVCEDTPSLKIADLSDSALPWTTRDYASSFARQGNEEFQYLLNFSDHYRLPLGVSAKLLLGVTSRTTGTEEIRTGSFKVKASERAAKIAEVICTLKKLVPWAYNSFFVDALDRATRLENFDIGQFVRRCESCPGILRLQPTTDEFLRMIEEIYNYRSAAANRLPVAFLAKAA